MEWRSKFMPSFFKVLIRDNFTRQLALPSYFVQQNRDTLPTDAKLQTVCGQTWYVKIENVGGGKHCFTKGWSEFVKSCKLKHGNFLVFWFDCDNSTFHVSFYGFHGCDYEIPDCKILVISDDEPSEDQHVEINGCVNNKAAMTSVFDDTNPQFEMVLKDYQTSRVTLRREFAEKADLFCKKAVILEYAPTQQCTRVLLDNSCKSQAFRRELALGWNDFLNDNELVPGKSYLFEYNRKRKVILVRPTEYKQDNAPVMKKHKQSSHSWSSRIKKNYYEESITEDDDEDKEEDESITEDDDEDEEEEHEEDSEDQEVEIDEKCKDIKGKVTKERPQTVLDKETSIAYRNAKSFKSNNPFFISLMYPSYVSDRFFLAIPAAFAKENLPKECVEVKLHVPNGGIWNVRCVFRLKRANLTGGWGKFAKDNNLKVGDVCVFEAIEKLLWNVIIYRG